MTPPFGIEARGLRAEIQTLASGETHLASGTTSLEWARSSTAARRLLSLQRRRASTSDSQIMDSPSQSVTSMTRPRPGRKYTVSAPGSAGFLRATVKRDGERLRELLDGEEPAVAGEVVLEHRRPVAHRNLPFCWLQARSGNVPHHHFTFVKYIVLPPRTCRRKPAKERGGRFLLEPLGKS